MPIPFEVADRIFRAEKQLLRPLKWESVEGKKRNEQRRKLECRVEVDGSIPRGVFFRITMFPRSLTRMTFQLETDMPSGRKHVPLYRLEMEPMRPHMNKMYGPDEINGIYIAAGQAHEHVFYDSLTEEGDLRSNPCEQARTLSEIPGDFATALGLVCHRISIENGDLLPSPGDQGDLL